MITNKKEQFIKDFFDFDNILEKFKQGKIFLEEKDFNNIRPYLNIVKSNKTGNQNDFADSFNLYLNDINRKEQIKLGLKVFYKNQKYSNIECFYEKYAEKVISFSINTNMSGKISNFNCNWIGEVAFCRFKFKCFKDSKAIETLELTTGLNLNNKNHNLYEIKKYKNEIQENSQKLLNTDIKLEDFFIKQNNDHLDLIKLEHDIDLTNMMEKDIPKLEVIYNIAKTSNKKQVVTLKN